MKKYTVGYEGCPIGIYKCESESEAIEACRTQLEFLDSLTKRRILEGRRKGDMILIAVEEVLDC